MKVAFLGDSLTWGGYGGDFVGEIQRRCPAHDIINSGHGGNTVINLLRRLDDVLAEGPDGIFVMIGGNDAISFTQPETRPYYEHVQKIPDGYVTPEQFEQTYRDLLTQIQIHHALAWVGLPPAEYNPPIVSAFRQYNTSADRVAQSLNIDVLDFMAYFEPESIPERPPLDMKTINLIGQRTRTGWSDYENAKHEGGYRFTFDGLHVMPDAAAKMAELIIDFVDL